MMELSFVKCFRNGYEDPVKRLLDMNFMEVPVETKKFREALDSGDIRSLHVFWLSDEPINSTYEKAFRLVSEYIQEQPGMYQLIMEHMRVSFLKRVLMYGLDYHLESYVYAALNNGAQKYVENDEFLMFRIRQMKMKQDLSNMTERRLIEHSRVLQQMLEHLPTEEALQELQRGSNR